MKLGSFDIVLHSVTHENNGTYMCKLRRDGIFYKNYTQLIVHSGNNVFFVCTFLFVCLLLFVTCVCKFISNTENSYFHVMDRLHNFCVIC